MYSTRIPRRSLVIKEVIHRLRVLLAVYRILAQDRADLGEGLGIQLDVLRCPVLVQVLDGLGLREKEASMSAE